MALLHLLYEHEYEINDKIHIQIPTVRQVLKNEEPYYNTLLLLTAMPIDMMLQLDEAGLDFTKVSEFDLFMMTMRSLIEQKADLSLFFGDLDTSLLQVAVNVQNNQLMLVDHNGTKIDFAIQQQIAAVLRKIHGLERNNRKPGNEEAREYMLERARAKAKRNKYRVTDSTLEEEIVSLVNTSEFHYDYEDVLDLTIYQFNRSLRQVVNKINYDNRMHGVFSGTVNVKELSQKDLTWLANIINN